MPLSGTDSTQQLRAYPVQSHKKLVLGNVQCAAHLVGRAVLQHTQVDDAAQAVGQCADAVEHVLQALARLGHLIGLGRGLGLGLGLAADDDLTKPFSLAKLLARVKALLRRADSMGAAQATAPRAASASATTTASTLCNGTLQIWTPKRQVRHAGTVLDSTAREFEQRRPDEFDGFLCSLVLFEPDAQLNILDAQGTVLACTNSMKPKTTLPVALPPVLEAVSLPPMPCVMGDDPERMGANAGRFVDAGVAVIAAKPLTHAVIRSSAPVAGSLYLVAHQNALPAGRLAAFRSSFALPALAMTAAAVA